MHEAADFAYNTSSLSLGCYQKSSLNMKHVKNMTQISKLREMFTLELWFQVVWVKMKLKL